jgi:hypothetical protein
LNKKGDFPEESKVLTKKVGFGFVLTGEVLSFTVYLETLK